MQLLPWHRPFFNEFTHLHEQGRLGHAWLITGPEGVGKESFCRNLAQWLFCSQRSPEQACGVCQDCHLFEVGSHPDWQFLAPEKKTITIGQIRELISVAQNTSQRGLKVLVISPAEAMNINAANALLKLLEEPPKDTHLFLVSHQSGQLLATLRSRCQQLALALPAHDEAISWLLEQGAREPERLLVKAKGAPLRALELLENDVLLEQEAILEQLEAMWRGDVAPIQAAKKCEKFPISTSIEYLLICCGDLLTSVQTGRALADSQLQPLANMLMGAQPSSPTLPVLSARGVLMLHNYYQNLFNTYKVALAPNNANALLILEGVFGGWLQLYKAIQARARSAARGGAGHG